MNLLSKYKFQFYASSVLYLYLYYLEIFRIFLKSDDYLYYRYVCSSNPKKFSFEKDINFSILCLMNIVYFFSTWWDYKENWEIIPLWLDYLILLNNLNKYLQKWISLINCFEIIFIQSLFSSCLLKPFSSFVMVLFMKLFIFIVWLKDIVFYEGLRIDLKLALVLLKLNFAYSWFFGDVILWFIIFLAL